MITIPGKIPILIRPTFWILCLLIGWINAGSNPIGILIWVGIVFISVLFHELGHALTALLFGKHPRIELVALGGVTYHDSDKLVAWKRFLIVLNGPLFGLALAILATILLFLPGLALFPNVAIVLKWVQLVNFFWTAVNLLPVVPLDGGQLLRIILEKIFGLRGVQYAFLASTAIAVLLSLACFLYQSFLAGAFFFLFAYQGYESWKQARVMTRSDEKESVKTLFDEAEKAVEEGRKADAIDLFAKVREESHRGLLYLLATQSLAFLQYEAGKKEEAYHLLLPIRDQLNSEALGLLHRLAFQVKNYSLVASLSGSVFQSLPNAETALYNAYAAAVLGQVEPAIGWLETAHQEGLQNLTEIIQEEAFNPIRNHPTFQSFLKTLKT